MANLAFNRILMPSIVGCWSLVVLGWGSVTMAETAPAVLSLDYEAPTECPTAFEVREAALRLAGQLPTTTVQAKVHIDKQSRGYRAHVETQAGVRQRLLGDVSCSALAEAVEVLLALAIDPDAQVKVPEHDGIVRTPADRDSFRGIEPPRTMRRYAGPTAPTPPSNSTSMPPRKGQRARSRDLFVAALVGAELGAMPKISGVFSLQVGVALDSRWLVMGSGRLWNRTSGALAEQPSMGGDFSLWTLGPSVCYLIGTGGPTLLACVGGEAGRLSGKSYGVLSNSAGATVWAAVLAELAMKIPINSALAVRLDVEAGVPLLRRPFELAGIDDANTGREVYRPAMISLRENLGLSVQF
jgi:hypothetical protein